jgi:TRAP-type C4-dicarboxylate transport system permease small subunit
MDRLMRAWDSIESTFVAGMSKILFGVALLLCVVEVIRRYCFNVTFVWGTEIIVLLFLFGTWIYNGVALKGDAHLRVDFITLRIPLRPRLYLEIITNLIGLIYCIALGVWLTQSMIMFYGLHSSLENSGMPISIIYFMAALGMFMMSFGFVEMIYQNIVHVSARGRE